MLFSILAFLACLMIGVPIAFALGLSSLTFLLLSKGIPLTIIAQRMFTGIDVFPFMAIPFFILAGELMNHAKITEKLVNFSDICIGHLKGGLGHVNIATSMFFAGITGSAVADTSALGSMLIPAMKKNGYDPDYSAAVTAASSVVGPIIPPSIPMVIFSLITGTSVGALFLAGFFPGVLLGISLMVVNYIIAHKRGYESAHERSSLKMILIGFMNAIIPLLMPFIILFGILGGIFTATEASAVAVVYALVIGFFVYRNMKLKDLGPIFLATAKTTGVVFLVIATANIFNWLMATENIPTKLALFFTSNITNKIVLILVINAILLFIGTFMDATAAMVITVPILLEITAPFGIHPVMLGTIVVLNLMIGLLTPPVGLCLFIAGNIAGISLERITKAVLPFLATEILVLLLVSFVEPISLYLPRAFGYIK